MEKAILKTLIYADLFGFPLKAWEIHKWLIGKKASLKQVEKGLLKKSLESRIKSHEGYYFLSETKKRGSPHFLKGRKNLVKKRLAREKQSQTYLFTAKWVGWYLRLVPWIKLLGVSGSLAIKNASKKDDIDLFVITEKNRLWISRLCLIILLNILGKRRKASDNKTNAAGKICVNLLLNTNSLSFKNKNIYLAHEILQMEVLWQRDSIYHKFLSDNGWVFSHLPNWITSRRESRIKKDPLLITHNPLLDFIDTLAKWFQKRYMTNPKGKEKISETALYFHPVDYGEIILRKYNQRLKKLNI